MSKPVIAIVGRPNVGKSTLFNKLIGERRAIVEDTPGVTRDRIYGETEWRGRELTVIDTGGIEPKTDDIILSHMRMQAEIAIESADVIIFLCDVRTGPTADDREIAVMLKKSRKPVVVAVNKCDSVGQTPPEFYEFYEFGFDTELVALSSVHGTGTGDLLDEVLSVLPETENTEDPEAGIRVAVIGKPNAGKSSLVNEIVYPELAAKLNGAKLRGGAFDKIEGLEYFDKVIAIDQSPIGRTPRSNPATYTGVFTLIRVLFAATLDAKERGYKSGRFSFNVPGGRCENCSGDGIIKIEMHFLPDVYVPCEVCHGKRYNRETLQVKYKGKSISDVLDMTVDEAVEFFAPVPSVYGKIKTLQDVGLGYIRLGQSSTTLSGGEAQRVKLATELSKRPTGKTLYILDEPTTGLHSYDVAKLCDILSRLREGGNTVIVIEHNLDVIKTADYIVDLGPEGGDGGGEVVACGSPEEVALVPESRTGVFLKKILATE